MRVPVIIGPTGSGKTELALRLTEYLPVEIISADSRKVFRYLDIGTAKPTYWQRLQAKFHMIDICNPDDYFSAGDYGSEATKRINQIIERGKIPMVVGGSGLYIESIFYPLPHLPRPDPEIREEINEQERKKGLVWLYKRLKKMDPDWAKRIDPHDRQRVKRGLEILRITKQPISRLIRKQPNSQFEPFYIGITIERKELKERVTKRVDRMINDGLILETRWLLAIGYDEDLNALKTIGYQEIIQYLKGLISLEESKVKVIKNTLLFAKRQSTWFKRFKDIYWIALPFPLSELMTTLNRQGIKPRPS